MAMAMATAMTMTMAGNKDAWESSGRSVSTLLLRNTSHCMHWFKARNEYEIKIQDLVKTSGWGRR
jgi:hypothetical protein